MLWKVVRAGLCVGVLSVLCSAPAAAQSEAVVRGQVTAEADGSPLVGGVVTLQPTGGGTSMETHVDATGRFVFDRVGPGIYTVTGAAEGFTDRQVRVDLAPREVRTVALRLALRSVEVNVTVHSEPTTLPATRSPSSTVLSSARIESLPVGERASLPDAIVTAAPGMIRGHDDFVHVRGEEIALNPLINGVAFWENAHSVFSAGFSPDVIDTANVMTGGFPAEYGNRFGGVVDIVTKSGLRRSDIGSMTLNVAEAGRRTASGDIGGRGGRIAYYGFGSLFETDRFLSPPDPTAIHDHGRGAHGFFQTDASLGNAGALRAIFMVDGTSFEIPKTPEDVVLRPQANATQRNSQQTATVGWTRAQSGVLLDATGYERWSRARLLPAEGPLTAHASVRRDLLTVGGKFDVTRVIGRHAIKGGIDAVRLAPEEDLAYDYTGVRDLAHLLEEPHIHVDGSAIAFAGRSTGGQLSGYLQDDVQLNDRVTIDAGMRVDRFDLLVEQTHVSPRVNTAIRVGRGAVVHASYDEFFVAPPIEGVLSSAAGLTAHISDIGVALPPVQPTTEHQVEVGGTAPAGPLRLGVTGYARTSRNPVHTTVWPDSRIYSYASFERAKAYGLEVKAEAPGLARHGASAYLNYALGRVYFYNPATGGFVTEPEHVTDANRFLAPMDQTHTLTAGASYRHARTGLFAATALEYGSGTPREAADAHTHSEAEPAAPAADADVSGRIPGHFTASVSFGIDLLRRSNGRSRLTVQADVENVTNNVYLVAQESEFSPKQFSIPRLFGVTAKIRF